MHPLISDVLVCSDDEKAKQVASEALVCKIRVPGLKWEESWRMRAVPWNP